MSSYLLLLLSVLKTVLLLHKHPLPNHINGFIRRPIVFSARLPGTTTNTGISHSLVAPPFAAKAVSFGSYSSLRKEKLQMTSCRRKSKDPDEDHGANQVDRTIVFSSIWDINSPPPASSRKVSNYESEMSAFSLDTHFHCVNTPGTHPKSASKDQASQIESRSSQGENG